MATTEIHDQYFTYEGRLASFKAKKRASAANGRGGKAQNWPHRTITPTSLAKAGFFFCPFPDNPDNVMCFLCHKGLDGWEAGDDPLLEHLKHSSQCGWAIVASIEAEMADYAKEDPSHPVLLEARKATFDGRWPHEGKRGWKCKTKQLVDAGWKYTPSLESDDMATCVYCQLALDGWEQNDKPLDEHHNRAPECPFFTLVSQTGNGKKTGRAKAARGSKASRLSVQSVATLASETTSVADQTTGPEDSVLTTASTMTQGGKKGRAKKGVAKGRKTKAKKEEPAEVEEPVEVEQPAPFEEESVASPPSAPPAKATRGRKRGSEAVDESTLTVADAPASKRRATKQGNTAVDSSVLTVDDTEMTDAPVSKKTTGRKKGRTSKKPTARKASAKSNTSVMSMMSTTELGAETEEFPDDDEIERQLQADLERQFSDDEIAADSDSERAKSKARAKESSVEKSITVEKTVRPRLKMSADNSFEFAMLDPSPAVPNEAEVEDEFKALQAEMEVDEPEQEQVQIPKKGRKPAARKVSKQSKSTKAKPKQIAEPIEEDSVELVAPEPQPDDNVPQVEEDASIGSTDTVVKTSEPVRAAPAKKGRGRPSKASLSSQTELGVTETAEVVRTAQPPVKRGRGRPSKASLASQDELEAAETIETVESAQPVVKRGRGRPSKASLASQDELVEAEPAQPPVKRGRGRPSKASQTSLASQDTSRVVEAKAADPPVKRGRGRPPKHSLDSRTSTESAKPKPAALATTKAEPEPAESEAAEDIISSPVRDEATSPLQPAASEVTEQVPATPRTVKSSIFVSSVISARQAALSPSQSPQSSDAENQPPSSKPATSSTTKRIALAPLTATPMRGSPSKRNVLAGLQSTTPWAAVDLDAVFGTPHGATDKENGVQRFLKQGKDLTSPEKGMTVEEWVYFNANEAEQKLKHECETMVSRFESEGSKAMNVLEGLTVE